MRPDAPAPGSPPPAEWQARHEELLREARELALPTSRQEAMAFVRLESRLGTKRRGGEDAGTTSEGALVWPLRWRVVPRFRVSLAVAVIGLFVGLVVGRSSDERDTIASRSQVPANASDVTVQRSSVEDRAGAKPTGGAVVREDAKAAPSVAPQRARLAPGAPALALNVGTTELEGEAEVEVAAASDVSATASHQDVTVTVQSGRVALHVRHREPGDRSFSVKAGGFSFQVLGTVFEVERSTGASVDLAVKQGLVAVVQDGQVLAKIGAGGTWHGRAREQARDEAAARASLSPGRALADAMSPERLGALPATSRHASPRAHGHLGAVASTLGGRAAVRRGEGLHDVSDTNADAVTASEGGARPGEEPEEAPARANQPTHLSRRASCLALETSGRAPEAISCYETLGLGDGLAAEASLYQAAVLRRDAAGDPEGALASFRAYQKRFPEGRLAEEVGISVAELLPRLGRYQEALKETDGLFARGAGHERRSELLMLRGRILLDGLKDPGRAEGTFAEVAAGVGDIAIEALYFRGLCLQKLGRTVEARDTFAAYLARGRVPAHLRDVRTRLGLGQL